jgi:hypothetical protein
MRPTCEGGGFERFFAPVRAVLKNQMVGGVDSLSAPFPSGKRLSLFKASS